MDKLLNWSLAQNDPETAKKVGAPDPELLAKLFGAADDPTLMKEALAVIENPEADRETKITAFENFEMLIENLDNANNIENMKMWAPLIKQLDHEDEEFQQLCCSIVGTAVQNNEKAQKDFTKYETGTKKLIELAEKPETRQKALYALSNLIRNHPEAYQQFDKNNGWNLIGPLITDVSVNSKIKLRSLSLLSSIISSGSQEDISEHIKQFGIIEKLLGLIKKDDNVSLIDKSLSIIVALISNGYKFSEDELSLISEKVAVIEKDLLDVINLDDFQLLKQVLN